MKKGEGTMIYGASDDLIEFDGDVHGEVGGGADTEEEADLVACSDGTMLKVWYGDEGIWRIRLLHSGTLLDRIDQCSDSDAKPHSDQAYFKPGLKCCYVGGRCQKAQ